MPVVALLVLLAAWPAAADSSLLASCHYAERPERRRVLPGPLAEISGLARLPEGRLLAHGDERGRLFLLDADSMRVAARYTLKGDPAGDFEAVAVNGGAVTLLTSTGWLHRFDLAAGPGPLPYTSVRTGLRDRCEFEGLAAEPGGDILLLACKTIYEDRRGTAVRIYRWDRAASRLAEPAVIEVPSQALRGATPWDAFHPSELVVVPASGNLLLLSSKQRGLLEITRAGAVVASRVLSPSAHRQPEAMVVTPDGDLLIGDEAAGARATLSRYRCHR